MTWRLRAFGAADCRPCAAGRDGCGGGSGVDGIGIDADSSDRRLTYNKQHALMAPLVTVP